MSKVIEARVPFRYLTESTILWNFIRNDLRELARRNDIPRGRNKKDTINNLDLNKFLIDKKVKVTVSIEME